MTLALLVLGPDKLPGLVRSLGRWMGRARAVARNLRVQIEREVAEMPNPGSAKPKPAQRPTGQPKAQAQAHPKQDAQDPTQKAAGDDADPGSASAPGTDNKTDNISDVAEPAGEKGSDPGNRF